MINKVTPVLSTLLLSSLSLGLIACSGDDDKTGFNREAVPNTPIEITSANQNQVAGFSTANLAGGGGFGADFSGGLKPQAVSTADSRIDPRTDLLNFVNTKIESMSTIAGNEEMRAASNSNLAQFSGNEPLPGCVTGSGNVNYNIAKQPVGDQFIASAGDSLTISFSNCTDDFGNIDNGSISMTVHDVNTANEPIDATMSFGPYEQTYTNFEGVTETETVHGSMRISEVVDNTGSTLTLSTGSAGLYFAESNGPRTTIYANMEIVDNGISETVTGTFTVDSTELNGRIALTFNDISGPTNGDPTSGNMVIVGRNATLTIIFQATNVMLELDLGSDGSVDETSTVEWFTLNSIDTIVN